MKLRRVPVAMAFTLVAIAGALGVGVQPASAHNVSQQSFFWCGAKRTFPNDLVIHSLPIYLDAHTVIYWCKEQATTESHSPMTYHVWVSLDDGSSAKSNVYDCPPAGSYCEPEP
jgi:hypothetical protein